LIIVYRRKVGDDKYIKNMFLGIFYLKNMKIHFKIVLKTNLFYIFIFISSTKYIFVSFIFIIYATKH